jgi:putative phosphoribosyl transferase
MNGFRDRQDAGRRLAAELRSYATEHPIVLALPRGGVPVGYEIARALRAPLDVWVVRKVGVPWHPELGVGAVAEGGYVHLNQDILVHIGLSKDELAEAIESKQREVDERARRFRGDHPRPVIRDRTVILVDDGIATGGTVRAAIHSIRAQAPKAIVLAVPVAAPQTVRVIEPEVDRVVCLKAPADLYAIGLWYVDFTQVSDDEVLHFLELARQQQAASTEVVSVASNK